MQAGKFNILVDLQWGSCGKGKFSAYLAREYKVRHLSGSNRPNAGHTVVAGDKRFVAKVLPSAAVLQAWENQSLDVWLSPGSCFLPERLQEERAATGHPTLYIHELAQILTQDDILGEKLSVGAISSTQQGSGYSLVRKIMRHSRDFARNLRQQTAVLSSLDFGRMVRTHVVASTWLHECAQGWALSLDHGHSYPYVTSRNCGVAAALDQMAVPPNLVGEVYGIFRPYPIRVGSLPGQTSGGTFPDSAEVSWHDVAHKAGMPSDEAERLAAREFTTVTGRQRRVFSFSEIGLLDAIRANGVTSLILNFAQYIDWADYQVRDWGELSKKTRAFIDHIQEVSGVPVEFVGTGESIEYVATP